MERACGGHDDDMLHEMALAEQKGLAKPSPYRNAPTRRRKHPDVLKELWSMALHPTSVSLVQRGCLALLSLCSEPGVNAHVRDAASVSDLQHHEDGINVTPSVGAGPRALEKRT